jgi:hypothetical protein
VCQSGEASAHLAGRFTERPRSDRQWASRTGDKRHHEDG